MAKQPLGGRPVFLVVAGAPKKMDELPADTDGAILYRREAVLTSTVLSKGGEDLTFSDLEVSVHTNEHIIDCL